MTLNRRAAILPLRVAEGTKPQRLIRLELTAFQIAVCHAERFFDIGPDDGSLPKYQPSDARHGALGRSKRDRGQFRAPIIRPGAIEQLRGDG